MAARGLLPPPAAGRPLGRTGCANAEDEEDEDEDEDDEAPVSCA